MNEERKWKKWVSAFVFALLLIVFYKTLDNFSQILDWFGKMFKMLFPFILGILVAYILYMPSRGIERVYKGSKVKFLRKKARTLSVLTVYIMVLIIFMIVINFVLPPVSKSIMDLTASIPTYYNNAVKFINEIPEDSILNNPIIKDNLKDIINSVNINSLISPDNITKYAKGVLQFAGALLEVFVTIVVSVYVLIERKEIIGFLKKLSGKLFKKDAHESIGKYFRKSNEVFFKFLYGQTIDGIVVGIITSIAMLMIGVKYAVLLGIMIGIFNLIPYFGAIIAVFIAFIITIFTGGIWQALLMVIIVIILQQIDSNIINPKILGNSLKISPLLVILAITLGGGFFGVLGMFLAVPVATVIKIFILDCIEINE